MFIIDAVFGEDKIKEKIEFQTEAEARAYLRGVENALAGSTSTSSFSTRRVSSSTSTASTN